jgi:hypothetical protein
MECFWTDVRKKIPGVSDKVIQKCMDEANMVCIEEPLITRIILNMSINTMPTLRNPTTLSCSSACLDSYGGAMHLYYGRDCYPEIDFKIRSVYIPSGSNDIKFTGRYTRVNDGALKMEKAWFRDVFCKPPVSIRMNTKIRQYLRDNAVFVKNNSREGLMYFYTHLTNIAQLQHAGGEG